MKNLKVAIITIGFLALASSAIAGDHRDVRFENKVQAKQVKLISTQVKKVRTPAGNISNEVKKRQEVLRSNGKLERLYNFSISL